MGCILSQYLCKKYNNHAKFFHSHCQGLYLFAYIADKIWDFLEVQLVSSFAPEVNYHSMYYYCKTQDLKLTWSVAFFFRCQNN